MKPADIFSLRRLWRPGLVLLQFAKVAYWFRDVDWNSGFPLVNVDYIQFYARILRMHDFLRHAGRLWGYDPFEMAGYISGPFLDVGTHALGLASYALLPLVPAATSILFMEIAGLALIPFLAFPILRCLGFGRRVAWVGFGVLVFTFGVCEPFSLLMLKVGLWGFMVAGVVSLLMIALLNAWLERRGAARWAAMTACAALVFQIHPTAVIVVLFPAAALCLFHVRRLGWRGHAALAAAGAIVAIANWDWMSPFLAFSHWRVTAPYYDTLGLVDLAIRFGPVQASPFASMQALINLSAVVLSAIAIGRLALTRPALARGLAVWVLSLFVISYFGSWIPWIRTLQPGRNEFVLLMLLYLLSATVLESHVLPVRRLRLVVLLLVPVLTLCMFEKFPGHAPWWVRAYPLRTELPAWQRAFINELKSDPQVSGPSPKGRVLLECADDLEPNFADILPHLTGVVLIGGPHPGNFLLGRSSLFTGNRVVEGHRNAREPVAFGRVLREGDEPFFAEHLALYNVTRVAARTPQMIERLDRMNQALTFLKDVPPYRLYRVRSAGGWFERGSGQLTIARDRVTIDEASAGTLVPRVHWFDTFKAEPPVPIHPVFLLDDPSPFLSVDNSAGHKHIEIFNGGLPPVPTRIRRWFSRTQP